MRWCKTEEQVYSRILFWLLKSIKWTAKPKTKTKWTKMKSYAKGKKTAQLDTFWFIIWNANFTGCVINTARNIQKSFFFTFFFISSSCGCKNDQTKHNKITIQHGIREKFSTQWFSHGNFIVSWLQEQFNLRTFLFSSLCSNKSWWTFILPFFSIKLLAIFLNDKTSNVAKCPDKDTKKLKNRRCHCYGLEHFSVQWIKQV